MASAAVLLLAAAVVVLLACLALADPPTREQSALLAILAATPQERKLGWSASTLACAWVGVTCDAANSTVIKLRLPGVGLVGPIPPSTIGRLTNLQVLSLRANRVSGAIPDYILRLSTPSSCRTTPSPAPSRRGSPGSRCWSGSCSPTTTCRAPSPTRSEASPRSARSGSTATASPAKSP
ncbi:probable inactive receptor kinase At2g26730 [Hordeum vulgare subsp. vulgare]|uniref:probable inactive receptor kinase At2g26730 n=1 Tax=Hordeum vulgare subsp. vulgare TaxID=112509 RepID=UPI001D1A35AD|nr:probable inactive receptor kinase At2g26730 [Hordeum vulgare subsp. vulgare]